jgi:hypothetical protein
MQAATIEALDVVKARFGHGGLSRMGRGPADVAWAGIDVSTAPWVARLG